MNQLTIWDMTPPPIEPPADMGVLLRTLSQSGNIQESAVKCYDHLKWHSKAMCSISGGYDSDIMLDLVLRCGGKEKTTFVFNDTGLEYDATKEHIAYLEKRYEIGIVRLKPRKSIPACVREYGVPFWSKYVSGMISRLQKHGFKWGDKPLDVLLERYPRCRSALRWWCSDFKTKNGRISKFNIEYVRGLKEFMMRHPPAFRISALCCAWAKKRPTHDFLAAEGFDLNCVGIRKQEGGARSTSYKSCFDDVVGGADNYRPLFWWTGQDKEIYRTHYGVVRSDCYEVWGMERTGCAGCPFGKDFETELNIAQVFAPNHYRAMLTVFGQSYDYTRAFLSFRERLKEKAAQEDETQTELEGVKFETNQ